MNKSQFLHAVKKEKDDFFMFGAFDLKSVNFNPQNSNDLRPISWWDHWRRNLEMKLYGKMYEIMTSEKPKDLY